MPSTQQYQQKGQLQSQATIKRKNLHKKMENQNQVKNLKKKMRKITDTHYKTT